MSRHVKTPIGAAAGNMYVLNILHYQLCYTSGLHHNLTILLSASLSNLQRIRRNFSGEDVTASKALVCRTPQARHAPPTQDDGHPMPPVSPVCHRRPVIAVSTSSPFCARNLAHELEELLRSRPPLTVGLIRQRDEVVGPRATHGLELLQRSTTAAVEYCLVYM